MKIQTLVLTTLLGLSGLAQATSPSVPAIWIAQCSGPNFLNGRQTMTVTMNQSLLQSVPSKLSLRLSNKKQTLKHLNFEIANTPALALNGSKELIAETSTKALGRNGETKTYRTYFKVDSKTEKASILVYKVFTSADGMSKTSELIMRTVNANCAINRKALN